jgi:NAD(P)-dependent dehydrogenase (short-subunit alcohol dehydrogenase family)
MNHGLFDRKVVLVTGATSGIGRGVAIAFAREGATVIGCGRNAEGGAETGRRIEAAQGTFTFMPMDVADETLIAATVRTVMDRHGRLDCAVNSAGFDANAGFLEQTAADFDRIFGVNVRGLFLCMREQAAAMSLGGGGVIVNIGSIAGQRSFAGNSLYNASKSALTMLTKSAAVECASFGVRINEVAPGPVMTPMLEDYLRRASADGVPVSAESLVAALPLGRELSTEDVAGSVLFLCSPQAANITGALLTVDGGFVLAW